jgi:hypothetical protein
VQCQERCERALRMTLNGNSVNNIDRIATILVDVTFVTNESFPKGKFSDLSFRSLEKADVKLREKQRLNEK